MKNNEWLRVISCSSRRRLLCASPPHTHPGYELFYTVSGTSHILAEDKHGKIAAYHMKPGEFIFVSGFRPHHLQIYENDNCHMILMNLQVIKPADGFFTYEALKRLCPEAARLFDVPRAFIFGKDLRGALCAHLTYLVQSVVYHRREAMLENITHLMLTACLIEISHLIRMEKGSYQSRYVDRAIAYIEQNYAEPMRISAVAASAGVHPNYLERIFHAKTGRSLGEYITSVRIENAKLLLENTTCPVLDVAIECGFSNRQHFGRSFKALTGVSPTLYRKKYQHNKEGTMYEPKRP